MNSARADCQTTLSKCDQAVETCKAALEARDKEIQLCRLGLQQSVDRNQALEMEVQDANSKLQSPLRNPFVMFAIGLVAGGIAAGFAFK